MNLDKLPNLDWSDIAREEIAITGEELVSQSPVVVQVHNIAVGGLIYGSFTAPPWFWFALAKGVTLKHLIDFRRYMEHIPRGALTAINPAYENSVRFAELYGFEDTGEVREYKGVTYKIFRRK